MPPKSNKDITDMSKDRERKYRSKGEDEKHKHN